MDTVKDFINKYEKYAVDIQNKYGIPAYFSLAQSALETGWGKVIKGNMMFGIKTGSNWKGDKQLLTTTEYHKTGDIQYPFIISVEPASEGLYKYKVKDYFRKYNSVQESFNDYGKFLTELSRYKSAFTVSDPRLFAQKIAAAGYSTSPNYAQAISYNIDQILKKKIQPKPEQVLTVT